MAINSSVKHLQIDRAKSTILVVVSVAAVVTIFSLFVTRSMLTKASYQRQVINEKHKVVKQLKDNIQATDPLITQYKTFAEKIRIFWGEVLAVPATWTAMMPGLRLMLCQANMMPRR